MYSSFSVKLKLDYEISNQSGIKIAIGISNKKFSFLPYVDPGLNPTRTTPCDVTNQYLTPQIFRQDPFVPSIIAAVDRAAFAIADAIRRQCRGVTSGFCPEARRRKQELKELVRSALKGGRLPEGDRRSEQISGRGGKLTARTMRNNDKDFLKIWVYFTMESVAEPPQEKFCDFRGIFDNFPTKNID